MFTYWKVGRPCPFPLLFFTVTSFFLDLVVFKRSFYFVSFFSFFEEGAHFFILLFLFTQSYRHLFSFIRYTWEMSESSSLQLLTSCLAKLPKEYVTQTPSWAQNHWTHSGDSPEISGFHLSTLVFYWNAGKSICQSLSVCTRFLLRSLIFPAGRTIISLIDPLGRLVHKKSPDQTVHLFWALLC